ncbi:WD40 repeat-like protein [Pisolithus sp. B1]|nr:WD40 repeat-like protein [Pisolithus sp. B1]
MGALLPNQAGPSLVSTVRVYDVATNEQKAKIDHRVAVLTCCFGNATHALDLAMEKVTYLGQHGNAASAVNYARDQNVLISGSWDLSLKLWDPRSSSANRVYHMDLVNNALVVSMASRPFHIYDIRKIESSLTFMTRSLACMSDGKGNFYAIGSVEGRIGEEYFDPSSEVQDQKYAFKCHRQTIEDVDHAWPVDSLAFHAVHNTFASAGSDETVSIWDRKLKKRLHQYPKYSGPIASVAFSCDGSRLAVVVSYTWDDGEEGAKTVERPAIWIRRTGDEVNHNVDATLHLALTIVEAYYMFII